MAFNKILCILVVFSVSALASMWDEELSEEDRLLEEEERQLALELRSLRERRIKAFECNKLGEGCRGVVPCCGSTQCYWKDGHSATKPGVCVTCIERNQICQRDASCCSGLVCQKEKLLYTDGRCDSPRSAGQPCHEDDQCASKNCKVSFWQHLKREDGSCA